MRVVVKLSPGGLSYQSGPDQWDLAVEYVCEDGQWDGGCYVYDISAHVTNSTELATWIGEVKTAVIASISTAGGPTVSASDITILGGPTV